MKKREVLLLTSGPYNPKHGSGVQYLQYFNSVQDECVHLYFSQGNHGHSDVAWSGQFENYDAGPLDPRGVLRRVKKGLLRMLDKEAWSGSFQAPKIKARHIRKFLNLHMAEPKVAYVCVLRAHHAAMATSILNYVGTPYIVHLMDVMDAKSGKADSWRSLIGNAKEVLAITSELGEFAVEHGAKSYKLVKVGFPGDPLQDVRKPPSDQLKLFATGRIFPEAYTLLSQAYIEASSKPELHYVGHYGNAIPSTCLEVVDHGYKSEAEYARIAAECHIGFVDGSLSDESFAHLSFPSRLIRMLGSGLPCVVVANPSASVAKWSRELSSSCVRVESNASSLREAIIEVEGSLNKLSVEALYVSRDYRISDSTNLINNELQRLRSPSAR